MSNEKYQDAKVTTRGGLTDVPGILVGNAEDKSDRTGCTVILCPNGAVPGADVSGGNPGTQQTDSIRSGTAEYPVYGVLLTGGSFFGLPAAGGVMRWLVEQGIAGVPLVPAAVIHMGSGAYCRGSAASLRNLHQSDPGDDGRHAVAAVLHEYHNRRSGYHGAADKGGGKPGSKARRRWNGPGHIPQPYTVGR